MNEMTKRRLLYPIYRAVVTLDKIKHYFKREVYVYLDYIHVFDEANNNHHKEKDGFHVYVCHRNVCHAAGALPWSSAPKLLDRLNETQGKPLELTMARGIATETLLIPKWANRKLAKQLSNLLLNEEE